MKWFPYVVFASVLIFASCGVDIQSGSQGAGQRCFFPSDCATGLTCYQRTCTPVTPGTSNRNNTSNNSNNTNPDMGQRDEGTTDTSSDVSIDLSGNCEDGRRLCIDEATRAVCIDENWVVESCADDLFCVSGDCEEIEMCSDRDQDGYGLGCPLGEDCDDRDPNVNPGERENCNTPVDDNCNQEVNENCGLCCAGGCGPEEFCNTQCSCESFNPDFCSRQNQPCDREGEFENGFFCSSIDGQSVPRCYGVCNKQSPNPNDTCPESNSVCAFGDNQQGICFSGCNFDQGCGTPSLGCLPWGDSTQDGMCIPTTPNQIGDTCDENRFFDCEEGALCVNLGGPNGARCRAACRPFEFDGPQTDCSNGRHCIGFSIDLGICRPDNGSAEGDMCSPQFTTCGEDAVGCYPGNNGGGECQRLCRLREGDGDCTPNSTCDQFDPQQDEIGICRPTIVPG